MVEYEGGTVRKRGLQDLELGEAEEEDLGAGVVELDGGFGVEACAFDIDDRTLAEPFVGNAGAEREGGWLIRD